MQILNYIVLISFLLSILFSIFEDNFFYNIIYFFIMFMPTTYFIITILIEIKKNSLKYFYIALILVMLFIFQNYFFIDFSFKESFYKQFISAYISSSIYILILYYISFLKDIKKAFSLGVVTYIFLAIFYFYSFNNINNTKKLLEKYNFLTTFEAGTIYQENICYKTLNSTNDINKIRRLHKKIIKENNETIKATPIIKKIIKRYEEL